MSKMLVFFFVNFFIIFQVVLTLFSEFTINSLKYCLLASLLVFLKIEQYCL